MPDPVVTIDEVVVNEGPSDYVHGANLELPATGSTSDSYSLTIEGWILSRSLRVEHVEVLYEERPVATIELNRERPDIAAAFPDASGATRSGYRATIGALQVPARFELVLRARLEDDTRLPLARLRGRRRPVPSSDAASIQPLIVNTIGRSGSTLLVTTLSSHPQVVAFAPFVKDARMATYWMSILQDLAEPQSFLVPFDPPDLETPHWWLSSNATPGRLGDPEVEEWLGTEAIESLAATCQSRIEAFYRRVAEPDSKPRYFVEKFLPYQVAPDLLAEVYPSAREVILVRDFRDQLCSVIAFNEKRGYQAFGRGAVASDAEYVETTLANSARRLLRRLRERGEGAHLVRYEDLIQEPETTLADLCRFMGIDSDAETVAATIERAEAETPDVDHHRTAGAASESIGRWRRDLSPELARICGETLDPMLTELGYEPTFEPAAKS